MLMTIAVIAVAMTAVAAIELWLFWRLGERDERRRSRRRAHREADHAEEHAQRHRRRTADMTRQGCPRGRADHRGRAPSCARL